MPWFLVARDHLIQEMEFCRHRVGTSVVDQEDLPIFLFLLREIVSSRLGNSGWSPQLPSHLLFCFQKPLI